MGLRVGIILDGIKQKPSLKWGNNQAVLENGRVLGLCMEPAERHLRKCIGRERKRVMGDYLYWFDSNNPEFFITFQELDKVLSSKFPGYSYREGSPKLNDFTNTLKEIFRDNQGGEGETVSNLETNHFEADIDEDTREGDYVELTYQAGKVPDYLLQQKIGHEGEELVNQYLNKLKAQKKIESFEWVSQGNPTAPLDFRVRYPNFIIKIDVKTTIGAVTENFFLSSAEIQEMSTSTTYKIYRVYQVRSGRPLLRVSGNLVEFSRKLERLKHQMPKGVNIDSVSVDPKVLNFESEVEL